MRLARCTPGARARRGFTLVELMVALVIGMGLTLAITLLLMRNESGRRTLTSVNDVASTASYLSFALDRSLRSAGSGFAQSWQQSFGCPLNVARGGAQILPRASAFPAPFATIPQTLRMAPLVIHAGVGTLGSDVLAVAAGSSGLGETAQRVRPGSATSSSLRVSSSLGLQPGDLLAVVQTGGTCMLQQIAAGFTPGADVQLDLGGTYAAGTINGVNLSTLGTTDQAWVVPLGNESAARPQLQLLGVGDNATLVSYDLLRLDGSDTPVPIADGVVTLMARYGIDADGDGVVEAWVSPASNPWRAADLLDGSTAARNNLRSIAAVRVGLVLRNSTPDREDVSPTSLTLFNDLPAALRVTVGSLAPNLRHRTLEFTVPLRNQLLPRT